MQNSLILFSLLFVANQNRLCFSDTCSREKCVSWNFKCSSRGCLNMIRFCDGHFDCPDGSDEIETVFKDNLLDANDKLYKPIPCNNVLNNFNKSCMLPWDYTCDGIQHCHDNSDENYELCGNKSRYIPFTFPVMNKKVLECPNCPNSHQNCEKGYCQYIGNDPEELCASSIFKCESDGKCLKASQFCDGNIDCEDGSDESTEMTSSDGIMCNNNWNFKNKWCFLHYTYICDGINHCRDRSDECREGCKYSKICDNGRCITTSRKPFYENDGYDDCGDGSDEDRDKSFHCNDAKSTTIAYERFCDGVIDCPNKSDEMHETDVTKNVNMFSCQNKRLFNNISCLVPKNHICDNHILCKDFSDETELYCNKSGIATYKCANGDHIMDYGFQICDGRSDCCDDSDECVEECDQTFSCDNGTCLAFQRFCDGFSDCADGSDEQIQINSNLSVVCFNHYNAKDKQCRLPEKYLCDGIQHCEDRSDECTKNCGYSFICADESKCILKDKFCDGITDCKDRSDEQANGVGFKCKITRNNKTRTCVLPQIMLFDGVVDCDDKSDESDRNFRCISHKILISKKQLCDGRFDCPDFSDECLCERELNAFNQSAICKYLCLEPMTQNECGRCNYGQINWKDACLKYDDIFSFKNTCEDIVDEKLCPRNIKHESSDDKLDMIRCKYGATYIDAYKCDGIVECLDFSDECNSECNITISKICPFLEKSDYFIHCPVTNQIIFKEVCDGVEDCSSSSFNTKRFWDDLSIDERFCEEQRFMCFKSRPKNKNLVSLPMHQLCDGNMDCLNEEDEDKEACDPQEKSRFYCETSEKAPHKPRSIDDPLFVNINLMFDNKNDCWDGSDECPSRWFENDPIASRHHMIKDPFLRTIVWLTAILGFGGNLCVIWRTCVVIYRKRRLSSMMKTNYILVLNLALSDFLMGVYLSILAVENARTSGKYCKEDKQWRASFACKILGTLAMVSIQCSVLMLVILTTYRVVVVLNPFKADSISSRYAGVLVTGAWALSITIAFLPHLAALENYFVASVILKKKVGFFVSDTPPSSILHGFLRQLAMYTNNSNMQAQINASYESNPQWINKALKDIYPPLRSKIQVLDVFGFYSSNSVCLPKIFVKIDDASWGYSFGIVLFDFIAFFYIFISYVIIYRDATKVGATGRNDEENRTMQTRITRLVLTDFICWIPVCILAFLSVGGVTIPLVAYAFAAIILLPINSALNPILYSNIISDIYDSYTKRLTNFIVERARMGRDRINRAYQRSHLSRGSTTTSTLTTDHGNQREAVLMLVNGANSANLQNSSTSNNTATTRV